jgi:hypothetical protein
MKTFELTPRQKHYFAAALKIPVDPQAGLSFDDVREAGEILDMLEIVPDAATVKLWFCPECELGQIEPKKAKAGLVCTRCAKSSAAILWPTRRVLDTGATGLDKKQRVKLEDAQHAKLVERTRKVKGLALNEDAWDGYRAALAAIDKAKTEKA